MFSTDSACPICLSQDGRAAWPVDAPLQPSSSSPCPPPQFICESLSEPGKVHIGSWCISLDLQLIHSKLSSLYEGRKWFALLP